jgi:pyrroline-5-carboxylate reductase
MVQPDTSLRKRLGRMLVIGAGAMGSAVISGLVSNPEVDSTAITVANSGAQKRRVMEERYGLATVADAAGELSSTEYATVFIAVRPGDAPRLADEMAATGVKGRPLLVSIMSGVSDSRLVELFGSSMDVIRVMPNTPLSVGAGMTLVAQDASAGVDAVQLACDVFSGMGDALAIPESLFDAGAALSGCGPAYFELVVDALARAGVRHGISRTDADRLANQTMLGTALLLKDTGKHPQQAIDEVTTPGGTTIAAIETMEALGLRSALAMGLTAAVNRAKEQR